MTFDELEAFLQEEKRKDEEVRGMELCGRYARCRYCRRYLENPCAHAHNALVDIYEARLNDNIPAWMLPEPPVALVFGADKATNGKELPKKPEYDAEIDELHSSMRDITAPSAPKKPISRPERAVSRGEQTGKGQSEFPPKRAEKRAQSDFMEEEVQIETFEEDGTIPDEKANGKTNGNEKTQRKSPEEKGEVRRGLVVLSRYDASKDVRYSIAKLKRKKS